jgi:hypothetical protein
MASGAAAEGKAGLIMLTVRLDYVPHCLRDLWLSPGRMHPPTTFRIHSGAVLGVSARRLELFCLFQIGDELLSRIPRPGHLGLHAGSHKPKTSRSGRTNTRGGVGHALLLPSISKPSATYDAQD